MFRTEDRDLRSSVALAIVPLSRESVELFNNWDRG
jgi:hypothetical protein